MTQAQIAKIVQAALAVALKPELQKAKAKEKFNPQPVIDRVCKKRGFKAAGVANVNVLTYGKWEAKGRRVIKGQKALKVGTLRLFHEEQTEPVTA